MAAVIDGILADMTSGAHRGVVVDSPPGAGKSTLVVSAALRLERDLMIVAQTNEQVDDLIERLSAQDPEVRIGRLSSAAYRPSERVRRDNVVVGQKVSQVSDAVITIATAAKWSTLTDGEWPWAIVDEAYQMRSDALLRVAPRFERALFVGDPGQLDPFSTVESTRWSGLAWDPLRNAVSVLLGHNPDLPVHRLPVSWRLPATAAPVVSEAFYTEPFVSGTGLGERRLALEPGAGTPADDALDLAATTGWALYELPARHVVRTDTEAVAAVVDLVTRLLARSPVGYSERGAAAVSADRIAVGVAHRDQAAAIRTALAARTGTEVSPVTVDTANRLQGREYDVTVILHPLSGRRDATAFHLEAGRLCVLTSRHRHACVVVARGGIADLLDGCQTTGPVELDTPEMFVDGRIANQLIMANLAGCTVPASPSPP